MRGGREGARGGGGGMWEQERKEWEETEAEEEREMVEGRRGETELFSAATAFLIYYLFLHLPHLLSLCLHLSFNGRKGTSMS